MNDVTVKDLIGKTLESVVNAGDEVVFTVQGGKQYKMVHFQDCCESVSVEEVVGDLNDLIGSPVLLAEEATQVDEKNPESGTWTFYKFATLKGYVDIRWYGQSNGYYSERVDFVEA